MSQTGLMQAERLCVLGDLFPFIPVFQNEPTKRGSPKFYSSALLIAQLLRVCKPVTVWDTLQKTFQMSKWFDVWANSVHHILSDAGCINGRDNGAGPVRQHAEVFAGFPKLSANLAPMIRWAQPKQADKARSRSAAKASRARDEEHDEAPAGRQFQMHRLRLQKWRH